jgi:hypothetical protein
MLKQTALQVPVPGEEDTVTPPHILQTEDIHAIWHRIDSIDDIGALHAEISAAIALRKEMFASGRPEQDLQELPPSNARDMLMYAAHAPMLGDRDVESLVESIETSHPLLADADRSVSIQNGELVITYPLGPAPTLHPSRQYAVDDFHQLNEKDRQEVYKSLEVARSVGRFAGWQALDSSWAAAEARKDKGALLLCAAAYNTFKTFVDERDLTRQMNAHSSMAFTLGYCIEHQATMPTMVFNYLTTSETRDVNQYISCLDIRERDETARVATELAGRTWPPNTLITPDLAIELWHRLDDKDASIRKAAAALYVQALCPHQHLRDNSRLTPQTVAQRMNVTLSPGPVHRQDGSHAKPLEFGQDEDAFDTPLDTAAIIRSCRDLNEDLLLRARIGVQQLSEKLFPFDVYTGAQRPPLSPAKHSVEQAFDLYARPDARPDYAKLKDDIITAWNEEYEQYKAAFAATEDDQAFDSEPNHYAWALLYLDAENKLAREEPLLLNHSPPQASLSQKAAFHIYTRLTPQQVKALIVPATIVYAGTDPSAALSEATETLRTTPRDDPGREQALSAVYAATLADSIPDPRITKRIGPRVFDFITDDRELEMAFVSPHPPSKADVDSLVRGYETTQGVPVTLKWGNLETVSSDTVFGPAALTFDRVKRAYAQATLSAFLAQTKQASAVDAEVADAPRLKKEAWLLAYAVLEAEKKLPTDWNERPAPPAEDDDDDGLPF